MQIRTITGEDAAAFLALNRALDRETAFMMQEPDERTTTADGQRAIIQRIMSQPNSTIFVVEDDTLPPGETLVGYLAAMGGQYRRNRHSAHIIIGVRQSHAGQGLGTRLFEHLDRWAREVGLHRLDLTVMAHNAAGVALYRKMGFEEEGVRRHSLRVDGVWVDELYMVRLLD